MSSNSSERPWTFAHDNDNQSPIFPTYTSNPIPTPCAHLIELTPHDRALLRSTNTSHKSTIINSLLSGLAFGTLVAVAITTRRRRILRTFSSIPEANTLLRGPFLERIALYTFMPFGGMAFGGVVGSVKGQESSVERVKGDEEACGRIEKCWLRVTQAIEFEEEERMRKGQGNGWGMVGVSTELRREMVRRSAILGMLAAFRGSK